MNAPSRHTPRVTLSLVSRDLQDGCAHQSSFVRVAQGLAFLSASRDATRSQSARRGSSHPLGFRHSRETMGGFSPAEKGVCVCVCVGGCTLAEKGVPP